MPERDLAGGVAAAEARGEAQAKTQTLVEAHERRLNALNGSIERDAKATRAVERKVNDLAQKIDEMAARMATQERLDEYKEQQEERNEQQRDRDEERQHSWRVALIAAFVSALTTGGVGILVVLATKGHVWAP